MQLRPSILTALVALAGSAALAPSSGSAVAQASPDAASSTLVVIVARELGVRDLSLATLRRVFRGDPTEAGGHTLIPFNYAPDNAQRRAFDLIVLGMPADEVGRYWVDRRIRGQGMPLRTAPSQLVLRAVVARLRGAIGYVTADQLDATVQALSIDGKSYNESGYPLLARSH